ncbi:MAG: hypothetical protein JXB26_02075 [Candidatus Aminicenantes bacterium]|nr:hypothetical protein [Candidatus Aminicenantes bacterium]
MRYKAFFCLFFLLFFPIFSAFGQFNPEELAERENIEVFLKNAEIILFKEIGEGVTKPYKLTLRKNGEEMEGCWKNPYGIQKGHLEGWQYEIAAYRMDKLLNLNMIPPTVEREFQGKRGSLQFWVDTALSELDRMENNINIPRYKLPHWNKMKYLTRAFDCLIANEDRTQQNMRYTEDWRTLLIDHSRSFRSKRKYRKQLMYGKNGLKAIQLFRILPRSFVQKVEELTFENIRSAVGSTLSDEEIEALLERKELLLKEIQEMIKDKGKAKVLY